MSAEHPPPLPERWPLADIERSRRNWAKVSRVEPEHGPGLLFKTKFLGSSDYPLDVEEYRRRQGARFTVETPAVIFINPDDSTASLRVEMIADGSGALAIAVRLLPRQAVWLPVLGGFSFRMILQALGGICSAK